MHKKRRRKKAMKKLFLPITILLIIIGLYYFWNENNNQSTKKSNNTQSPIKENQVKNKEIYNSIFKEYYDEAEKIVNKMTLEEKIGQLFLVRYNRSDIKNQKDYFPGGYILFAKDFENHTKESIKQEIDDNQKISKYPLIIGVDEEGGYVTRVSRYPSFRKEKFASPKYYYEQGGYELLEKMETEKANLLKEIGINLNLAPVSDVSTSENDFIYNRAFGKPAQETAEFVEKMVEYANNNHINSCLKHFPGYGNNKDTHTGIAIDNRTYKSFVESDFLPFKSGIKANVPSILVSHNIISSMDKDYPASLSPIVIKELRENLGFTGIIMTDDLAMDAVKRYVENKEAATKAINAGNDMIITSDFIGMYQELQQSVKEGKIKEETINKAVLRIIAWKYYSNIF